MSGDGPAVGAAGALRDRHVANMLRACGQHIGLVVDRVAENVFAHDQQYTFMKCQMEEQTESIQYFCRRPLLHELQRRYKVCDCSPFGRLLVTSVATSGSSAERLYQPPRPPVHQTPSDADRMIELGPVQWAFPADTADSPAHGGDWPGTGPAPRLHITDTENPGFVLLLQEKRASCRHSERLAFRAEHVTQLLTDYLRLTAGEAVTRRAINGPACSYSTASDTAFQVTEYDDVPCLRIPVWWFSDEFFTRQRRYGWPSQAVLDDIRQFGLHLVPVGAPGSRSQQIEWRLSFSRAELAVVSVMTDIQRFVVIAFKVCKAALGTEAKPIKSYYAKTAMLWLCEQTPAHEWTSVTSGLRRLLDFLDEAVSECSLPCFFWSRINLLRSVSRADRKAMKRSLTTIRKHMMSFLTQDFCVCDTYLHRKMTERTGQTTEHQVRLHLARWQILVKLRDGIRMHISLTTAKGLNSLLPVLLRTYTPDEISGLLGRFKHWRIVHNGLYRALSVAPAEVAAQVRLSFSPDGGLMWDAAPLLALLSAEDMRSLLGDPDAVRLWLRRQSRRPAAERPPGLPTDLSSPRDRCRLLLNIPQLCWVLSESVRWKWDAYQRHAEQLPMALTSYEAPAEVARQSVLRCLLQVELGTLEEDLRTELRMDRSTAASTAHRVRDAMQQMYSHPQTIFSYMRSLPDSWRLRHLLAT